MDGSHLCWIVTPQIGPVLGRVTSSSATLLLEVDRDTTVRCTLTEAFTIESRCVTVSATGGVPFVVTFDDLWPERRYNFKIEGVANADQADTAITTLGLLPGALNLVGVTSDCPEVLLVRREGVGLRGCRVSQHCVAVLATTELSQCVDQASEYGEGAMAWC